MPRLLSRIYASLTLKQHENPSQLLKRGSGMHHLRDVQEPATIHTGPQWQAHAQVHTGKEGRNEVFLTCKSSTRNDSHLCMLRPKFNQSPNALPPQTCSSIIQFSAPQKVVQRNSDHRGDAGSTNNFTTQQNSDPETTFLHPQGVLKYLVPKTHPFTT